MPVFRPVAPDADWETVRARLMTALRLTATTWSDHNAIEPGVTLTEAIAFGLADLHYRTATRTAGWPVEVPAWEADEARHWHAVLPPDADTLAGALAATAPGAETASTATVLEPMLSSCPTPADADALLTHPPWAARFTSEQRPFVTALLRGRLVRRLAHELTDLIAQAVDAQRGTRGTIADRDARAVTALATAVPLWPDELRALVRRERRRRTAATVLARVELVRAATTQAAADAVRADLAQRDLEPAAVDVAMTAATAPPGVLPEALEDPAGASRLWPPHPVQALTCEPVTADDYARRARAHPQVLRAWAVRGRLVGVGWDGRAVDTAADVAGAITLVVERMRQPPDVPAGDWVDTPVFLREVLATAIGSEVVQPHPSWRDTHDVLDPRRTICDEVGAALLRTTDVTMQGRLVTGLGADRAATVGGALARVVAHFAEGRAEIRPNADAGPLVDGPWPRTDQPARGWNPGEPIRFSEVVQVISADPAVQGVEELAMRAGTGPWVPSAAGLLPLEPGAVPWLADVQCLRVRFSLTGECGDA